MNLEHLMAKFKYDMKVIQKKQRMLKEGRDDVDFEEMDAELSEGDDYNDAESIKFKEFLQQQRDEIARKAENPQQFDDTPYKTREDESQHLQN